MTTRCLKLDPATGDLVHDGRTLALVADLESIAQSLRTRLAFFQGEDLYREDFGTPYFQTILGKSVPLQAVREAFRQIIADTPGVLDIITLELTPHDGTARAFDLNFVLNTDLGELILTVPTGV